MLIRLSFRRNEALHLFLPWSLRNPAFQDAVEALDSSLFQRSACIIFLEEIPPEHIADKKGLLNIISCAESLCCPCPVRPAPAAQSTKRLQSCELTSAHVPAMSRATAVRHRDYFKALNDIIFQALSHTSKTNTRGNGHQRSLGRSRSTLAT